MFQTIVGNRYVTPLENERLEAKISPVWKGKSMKIESSIHLHDFGFKHVNFPWCIVCIPWVVPPLPRLPFHYQDDMKHIQGSWTKLNLHLSSLQGRGRANPTMSQCEIFVAGHKQIVGGLFVLIIPLPGGASPVSRQSSLRSKDRPQLGIAIHEQFTQGTWGGRIPWGR